MKDFVVHLKDVLVFSESSLAHAVSGGGAPFSVRPLTVTFSSDAVQIDPRSSELYGDSRVSGRFRD